MRLCTILVNVWSFFAFTLYPRLHNPLQHFLFVLSIEGKKWRGMTFPLLLSTSQTITVARNFVCKTSGTFLGSLHNHLSSLQSTLWSWSKFFSSEMPKHSKLLMFQLGQQAIWADQLFIFCICMKLTSTHHIWLVSKILMHSSSDIIPWNLDLLSNSVNQISAFLIYNLLHL